MFTFFDKTIASATVGIAVGVIAGVAVLGVWAYLFIYFLIPWIFELTVK